MTKLQHLLLLRTSRLFYSKHRLLSKMSVDQGNNDESFSTKGEEKVRPICIPDTPTCIEDIVEPTNCCMSGCPNCVWIEYAEKLSAFLKDSPGDIQKMIMEKVQDPNMRAFLSMELRVRKIIE